MTTTHTAITAPLTMNPIRAAASGRESARSVFVWGDIIAPYRSALLTNIDNNDKRYVCRVNREFPASRRRRYAPSEHGAPAPGPSLLSMYGAGLCACHPHNACQPTPERD
ncbi:hypothetical protein GCM10009758_20990 [Microbacterium hatanonis]